MFVYRIKTYEKDKQQVLFVAGKEAALIKARKLSYDMRDVLVSVEEIRISKKSSSLTRREVVAILNARDWIETCKELLLLCNGRKTQWSKHSIRNY